jgi:hypothetical protein
MAIHQEVKQLLYGPLLSSAPYLRAIVEGEEVRPVDISLEERAELMWRWLLSISSAVERLGEYVEEKVG